MDPDQKSGEHSAPAAAAAAADEEVQHNAPALRAVAPALQLLPAALVQHASGSVMHGNGGGVALGSAVSGSARLANNDMYSNMERQISEMLNATKAQMQLTLQQQDQSEKREKERSAHLEQQQQQMQADATIRALIKSENKESVAVMMAIATLTEKSDRWTLSNAYAAAMQELETSNDDGEANRILRTAVKRFRTLSPEQIEDMLEKIKIKKRASAASQKSCTNCGRTGHEAQGCYAATHQDGTPLQAGAKRMRAAAPFTSQQAAPVMFGGVPYPSAAGFGAGAMPMQGAVPGAAGSGMYPTMMQQQAHHSPYGPSLSYNNNPVWTCYHCLQKGHKQTNCPLLKGGAAGGVVAGGGAAGAGAKAPGMVSEYIVIDDVKKQAQQQTMQTSQHAQAIPVLSLNVALHSVAMCDVVMTNVESDVLSKPTPSMDVAPAIETSVVAASAGIDPVDDEPSLAEMYAFGDWELEEPEESIESESAAASSACTPAAAQHNMYNTRIECDRTSSGISFEPAPVLVTNSETPASLAALASTAHAVCDCEMPAHTQSLRQAMHAEFEGKKKVLSDDTVNQQSCLRCKKTGHTAFSCPDQTQAAEADKSAEHKWVRTLIESPRVDIDQVNKGLSLEEGVAAWLKRGEEMNRGNPWTGSTKKEDSLRKQLGYHKAMGMSNVHLGWIGFGVPLQFIEEKKPRPLAFRNHKSAEEEEEFVTKEHASSVADGSFVKVPRSYLKGICPLQVVKHPVTGKRRLVQDLRWINGHLPNVKFRMESLHRELGDVVKLGDKLLTTDIAKAYYCLAMHPDAQQYLGWEWKGEFYMPTCLVFGLASAPRIFTKIMRPMMAFMRSLGVRVLGMIDDYLWADRPERILALRTAVQTVMPALGWTFNEKCEWSPADEVLMLGMLINTKMFQVRAPAKKVEATLANLHQLLRKQEQQLRVPVMIKEVQRATGRLMSMMLAFIGMRVWTRHLYRMLAVAEEGNETRKREGKAPLYSLQLSEEAWEEIKFWIERLRSHNGQEINCRENQVQMLLWSDASDVGWGGEAAGVTVQVPAAEVELPATPVSHMVHGMLPRREIARSSTRRELIALQLLAQTPSILEQIRGKRIKVIMDSIPALRNLVKGGGPVAELCEAVKNWFKFCEEYSIRPVYEWVERAGNWRADQASKLDSQQHTFKHVRQEAEVRSLINAVPATQWRSRNNHFIWGKVALFLPMFHQVDARVEMIRSQLEEAIILVPKWPAGGMQDWYRRIRENSIAQVSLGKVSQWYKERPQTGHDDQLEAFWLMGRRGEKKRADVLNTTITSNNA